MRSKKEIERRLLEIMDEKEELLLELDIHKSYDVLEEIAGDIIKEVNKGLSLTGIRVNFWRIEDDCNVDDNDWSLTANYCDIDKNIDIEAECKDLYDEMNDNGWFLDNYFNLNEYELKDLRFDIMQIIEKLVNEVMEKLINLK